MLSSHEAHWQCSLTASTRCSQPDHVTSRLLVAVALLLHTIALPLNSSLSLMLHQPSLLMGCLV